jgi:hypothetical protein
MYYVITRTSLLNPFKNPYHYFLRIQNKLTSFQTFHCSWHIEVWFSCLVDEIDHQPTNNPLWFAKIKPKGVLKPPKHFTDSCNWRDTSCVSMVQKGAFFPSKQCVLHYDVWSVGFLYYDGHHGWGVGMIVNIGVGVWTIESYCRNMYLFMLSFLWTWVKGNLYVFWTD